MSAHPATPSALNALLAGVREATEQLDACLVTQSQAQDPALAGAAMARRDEALKSLIAAADADNASVIREVLETALGDGERFMERLGTLRRELGRARLQTQRLTNASLQYIAQAGAGPETDGPSPAAPAHTPAHN